MNGSNFQPKFHVKATSGNTGLIFSIVFISIKNSDISRAEFKTKLSPVLPEVAISRIFHQNFDMFIHAEFSINQKIESTVIF